jgi:hypothetical protein
MSGRTAAPFPPASLSGEGLEGWVAAVTAILKSGPGFPFALAVRDAYISVPATAFHQFR